MKTITVTFDGEQPEYCRQYFKSTSGKVYARQEDFHGVFNWYTTTQAGEPEIPITDIHFEVVCGCCLGEGTLEDISGDKGTCMTCDGFRVH